ncbi:MAG: hypothetical protein WC975_16080 [Phycisphaerae bacterium]
MDIKIERLSLKKNYNKSILLNSICEYVPISRTSLRGVTNIRMATITDIVKELSRDGFVRESQANGRYKEIAFTPEPLIMIEE